MPPEQDPPAPRPRRTLGAAYSGRDNAFNFLRLVFALMVLVGHSDVLGFGRPGNPLRLPVDLGGLAVVGFFALSGFLITRSGRRTGFVRYWWHRLLRIFPALWVCLLLTAFVIGPSLWVYRHGTLGGYRSALPGPLSYLRHNFYADLRQNSIGDVLVGRYSPSLNGSVWTLKYELACYALVSALALLAVLRRARPLVAVPALLGVAAIGYDFLHDPVGVGPLIRLESRFTVPLAGVFMTFQVVVLTTAFLLGACAELFRDRLPLNDVLGALSLLVVAAALYYGLPLLGPALPAYVYLLLWLGVRLPSALRRVGRHHDYSYGVYIYAFLVQQTLGVFGLTRYGEWAYLATCMALTLALAAASWHLVERPALRLKTWTPRLWPAARPPVAVPAAVTTGTPAAALPE